MPKQGSKGQAWVQSVINTTSTSCVEYPYAKDTFGYGLVGGYGRGRTKRAHRVMYETTQRALQTGEVVMHMCDNPACCNPHHLTVGTLAGNNTDRALKGRSAKEVFSRRRLNVEQCSEIAYRMQIRTSGKDLVNGVRKIARDYGVDTNVIYRIHKGTYLCAQ